MKINALILIILHVFFLINACSLKSKLNLDSNNLTSDHSISNQIIPTDSFWKADTFGCTGYREKIWDSYWQISKSFVGIDTNEIFRILGKPNRIYKLKFDEPDDSVATWFTYFVGYNEMCEKDTSVRIEDVVPGATLNVIFNAKMKVLNVNNFIH